MLSGFYELSYWPLAALTFLAQKVPLKIAYQVARILGDLSFYTWPEGRKNSIENMRRVLGPEVSRAHIEETARRSFRNYFSFLVDFFRFPRLTQEEIEGLVGMSFGLEHLDEALKAGRGTLFVGPHFGNWEYGAIVLAMRGYPVSGLFRTFRSKRVTDLILRPRVERGIKVIPTDGDIRGLYRALKRNEVVGIAIDRPYREGGIKVRFFGGEAYLPPGPAAVALRSGAQILTGYCIRRPDNTYGGGVFPPLEYAVSGDRDRDIVDLTQRMASAVEDIIRVQPDQWYMFRRIWA